MLKCTHIQRKLVFQGLNRISLIPLMSSLFPQAIALELAFLWWMSIARITSSPLTYEKKEVHDLSVGTMETHLTLSFKILSAGIFLFSPPWFLKKTQKNPLHTFSFAKKKITVLLSPFCFSSDRSEDLLWFPNKSFGSISCLCRKHHQIEISCRFRKPFC